MRSKIAFICIRLKICQYVPDSGQEHTADGDDGFLVTTVGFDTAITICDLRMFLRFDQSICNMHQNWFKIGTSTGVDLILKLL